jgi:hypothetical protein
VKVIEYTTRREIYTTPIVGSYVAYKELTFVDGNKTAEREGVTAAFIIEGIAGTEGITAINTILSSVNKEIKGRYVLFRHGAREVVARYPYGWEELSKGISELRVDKPYTYVTENGMHDVEMLCYCSYDGNLYDMAKVVQPRAYHFTHIDGQMNNQCYDLGEVVRVLEKRDDIIWHDGRRSFEKWGQEDSKIQRIPLYNADEDRTHCLDFIWCPKEEDFAKVREDIIKDSLIRYAAIAKKVFGLTKKTE